MFELDVERRKGEWSDMLKRVNQLLNNIMGVVTVIVLAVAVIMKAIIHSLTKELHLVQ